MSIQTASSGLAYATKDNIQYPGTQAQADLVDAAAVVRFNELFGLSQTSPQGPPLGGSAAIGIHTRPTLDAGDIDARATGETTLYNIPVNQ